ncbi:MAG: NAD(P)/FAD-dependent oxidoreductase [Oscillospiraceae bacterium]|jgi:predicted Rossmann fold flavoprotein|nr:NAD(P)/FAD-dependent oxidoreductase [Oscillospiraceae bacterium]
MSDTQPQNAIIVGGGAAGLYCAFQLAKGGVAVTVFERNPLFGKKLRITGKGRCNMTNDCTPQEFLDNIYRGKKSLRSAIYGHTPQDVMAEFESIGVPVKVERGNRVFPMSENAHDVAARLENVCRRLGAELVSERVTEIILDDTGTAVGVVAAGTEHRAGAVVIATGGLSYPKTGSTGDGYRFAQRAGLAVTEKSPSLVPLLSDEPCCPALQGLSLKNVRLTVTDDEGREKYSGFGEMLFTDRGISGPLILTASAQLDFSAKACYNASIDLKPAVTEAELDARLLAMLASAQNKDVVNALHGLLPASLLPELLDKAGIDGRLKANSLTKDARKSIIRTLKGFSVAISGPAPIDEAVITRGGVDMSEISSSTMQSKKVPGLYFIGEVLDLDGKTGGFNLQIAWSTAFLAAKAVTASLLEIQ